MKTRTTYRNRFNVVLIIISVLVISCSDSGPPCGPFSNYIYDINSMTANIYEVPEGVVDPLINDVGFNGASIVFPDFLMVISAENITYIANNILPDLKQNWLIKTANACSPPVPYTDETIASISVTSNNDYNSSLPAGAVLNELFIVNYQSQFPGFPATLYSILSTPQILGDYVSLSPNSVAHLGLRLIESPSLFSTHIFTITYTHNSGESFILNTQEITFQ